MLPPTHKTRVPLIILQLLLLCFSGAYSASQPPYQVSLYVSLHPRAPPIHYCNGVIVQSSLILTAASCTYYQSSVVEESGAPVRIPSSKITVVPGVAGTYNMLNTFDVLEINIAPGFNYTTLANNLAILRLDTTLPLGQRADIQWIIMDDYVYEENGLYMAGFPSLNVDPNSMLLEGVQILPNEQCAQTSALGNESICVRYPYTYPYAIGPDCEYPSDFPSFNNDYGTGLIVRSQLVALFSHTIATTTANQNTNNCQQEQQPFNAIFTAVGPHVDWIYGIIASEEMLALHQNDFMYSAPYQQDVNSAIMYSSYASELMPSLIETTTTMAATVLTTTTEVTTSPSSTEVSSTLPPCVSAAGKAVGVKAALLFCALSYILLAYFMK
ncbi:uncharacterized protein LOC105217087 [Zeugodacus cucurbitae]|uniref:uncharacterized protein LOC105217087 n=1 Tax=Zeugodacus cucurbitae TaxID=28588 RepID=UPI0023D96E01|nr:uncharacterized protein LOC105217087 [Zeugodacus cucurbitae]